MKTGKSSQNANRLKKQRRMESKKDLRSYYTKVARVPNEKGLKTYTKLVDEKTADKLINGKIELDLTGIPHRVKLSRDFQKAS